VPQDKLLGYAFINHAAEQGLAPAKDTLDQLNQLMPAADREKALALAKSIPTGSPVAATKTQKKIKAATAPKPERAKPERPTRVAEAKPPAAKPKPAPAASLPASGGWRIQLGAFSQRGSAEALYQRLSGKSALAGRQPYYVAAGTVTRLQVGPYASRSAAEAACRGVGVACFPVPAK
jgi:hypothetical protein